MSDEPREAPQPDQHGIASVLENLLLDDPDDDAGAGVERDSEPPYEPGDNASIEGAEDGDAIDDGDPDDDDDLDDDDEYPYDRLDPPSSWNGEDRLAWEQLPRGVQETIRRRDAEMTGHFHRTMQQVAEEQRGLQAAVAQAEQERAQYAANMAALQDLMAPEAARLENVDWPRLAQENPALYAQFRPQLDALRARAAGLQQERARIEQTRRQQAAVQLRAEQVRQHQLLVRAEPAFGDPAQAPHLQQAVVGWLARQGFNGQEIGAITMDHRVSLAVLRAARLEQAEMARQSVQQKRVARPAPVVQRPGTAAPLVDPRARQSAKLAEAFGRDRSEANAAALIASWLS